MSTDTATARLLVAAELAAHLGLVLARPRLGVAQRDILETVAGASEGLKTGDIASTLGLPRRQVQICLKKLTQAGLLRRVRAETGARGQPPYLYWATEGGKILAKRSQEDQL